MNNKTKREIVKKLLTGESEDSCLHTLLEDKPVSEHMLRQWDTYKDVEDTYKSEKLKIFNRIREKAWESKPAGKILYYKISLAASVLLLLGISAFAFTNTPKQTPHHVFITSSGIQNFESVTLPDGSTVQLGPGTKLTYPEHFTGTTREVTLDGQAFFDISPNKGKPFIVHTKQMDINVMGTSFELFSYDIESKIEAILLHGKIRAEIPDAQSDSTQEIVLAPNEKLTFDKHDKSIQKETVDADKYTSWRKRGFVSFQNEKLSMIIPRLEQWYGRKVICQKDIAEQYHFTFKVRDESLERILFILGKSSPIKYRKTNEGDYVLFLNK